MIVPVVATLLAEPDQQGNTTNGAYMASQDLSALTTLAKPGAIAIYRYLSLHPNSFYGDVVAGTGLPTASVSRYLQELEAGGLVVGDIPAADRRGRSVRYSARESSLEALLERVRDAIHGEADE